MYDRTMSDEAGRVTPRGILTVCLVTLLLLSGCTLSGLSFRKDGRLTIENLADRSEITIPYLLEFSFAGTLSPTGASAFGVLIDWTPPPPGKTLASLLDNDPACSDPLGCPEGYLERNRITVTTETSIMIDNVPVGTDRQESRGYHEITIVLVDAEGRRVGETSAFARFRVPGINE